MGNEEAKLIGMEGNRRIGDGTSIIAGPFFICGLTEDDFRGLTAEEAEKYIGKKADKNRKIYNGMLKTYYYQFLGPRPPKKNRS